MAYAINLTPGELAEMQFSLEARRECLKDRAREAGRQGDAEGAAYDRECVAIVEAMLRKINDARGV